MAASGAGYGLPARPSDGYRGPATRRTNSNVKRPSPRLVTTTDKQESLFLNSQKPVPSQSRLPSRMPQPSLVRQDGSSAYSAHQQSSQPARSPSASTSHDAKLTRLHNQSGSGSSSSTRSIEGSRRSSQSTADDRKTSIPRQKPSIQNSPSIPLPSSRKRFPRGSQELAGEPQKAKDRNPTLAFDPATEASDDRSLVGKAPVIYPELDRYRHHDNQLFLNKHTDDLPYRLSTHDLPPPTPASLLFSGSSSQVSAFSASPSTKFSDSPGPGPYSRDTTPTSISSQSPGLVFPTRAPPPLTKIRQTSPAQTRPPVTKRRAGSIVNEGDSLSTDPFGLAPVRESSNSSSSNSTVRAGESKLDRNQRPRKLPPPHPSPPPRKSSQKFQKVKAEQSLSAKSSRQLQQPSQGTARSQELQVSPTKSVTPLRPSRDGTPDLKSQVFGHIPVIQSNMLSISTERRGSESAIHRPSPSSSTLALSAGKNASTSQLPVTSELRVPSKTSNQDQTRKPSVTSLTEPPRSVAPTSGSSFSSRSRFPFFGRKKTPVEADQSQKKETKKLTRKGPAAGTGHEGYGRLGSIRRRSSGLSISRGHPDSQLSPEIHVGADAFFAERMNPVVIAGGEIIDNRNTSSELSRTESSISIMSRPSTESQVTSDLRSAYHTDARTSLWPSAMPRSTQRAVGTYRPSESSDSEGPIMKPTLAFRRSVQRLKTSPDSPLRLPQPITTDSHASSPMTSFDASVVSDDGHIGGRREVVQDSASTQAVAKKLQKRARSPRKWNLFSRSQHREQAQLGGDEVAATVSAVETRPVPYYAIMDPSESEDVNVMDVQDVLRDAEILPNPDDVSGRVKDLVAHSGGKPERLQVTSAKTSQAKPARPSRLPQVGRIPQVVSHRDGQLSPKSFSRPFRASLQLPPQPLPYHDPESIAKGPSPPETSMNIPDLVARELNQQEDNENTSPDDSLNAYQGEREFLAFSPRKNSEGTVGTSSSSSGYGLFSTSAAVIPTAYDPPAEDEIWDEYDDLLKDETLKLPQSATSSKGVPFHLESYHDKLGKEEKMVESPTIALTEKPSKLSLTLSCSSFCSTDMTERLKAAFQPHNSTMSTTLPEVTLAEMKTDKFEGRELQRRPSSASSVKTKLSDNSTTSSENVSALAQVNLRVGSMTVSKWLTFGHVLFSDLRHKLMAAPQMRHRPSILVIDGLGNDDWSFYAAETYPAASFYNLSPRAPLPSEPSKQPSKFPMSPTNHYQIQYLSHADKFPFASQSFDSVVYRFPVAAPEAHYQNIFLEARRVLRAGGYMEMAILDVDLNNMGNRGRRAIRNLKERVNEAAPGTSLASMADLALRFLGSGSFTGIKAARVGVPVATSVIRSSDPQRRGSSSTDRMHKSRERPSLSEMMRDNSANADANITKMVARVGRWWYTRCYENLTLANHDKSIWDDRALLKECRELGTSLKLTVCCARAPDEIPSY